MPNRKIMPMSTYIVLGAILIVSYGLAWHDQASRNTSRRP
jgi:hypothetical protein